MRQYIYTSPELIRNIRDTFEVDASQIWKATHYLINSQRAQAIRDYALAHGGKAMTEDYVPDCRTEHRVDAVIQRFGAGVVLTFNKVDGSLVIAVYGREVSRYEHATIAGWGNACAEAQTIADARKQMRQEA